MFNPSLVLLGSIVVILILLGLKIHPGFAIFIGSFVISLLVLPLQSIPSLLVNTLFSYQTIRLLVIVASALTLSYIMEGKGLLARLAGTMESINPKLALHSIPAVIGLVPMPAGALVSATAARSLVDRIGLTNEQSTFLNYWFRHIWEFSLPAYPAIIVSSVLLSIPLSMVVATLFPMTAVSIAAGAILSYVILRKVSITQRKLKDNIIYSFIQGSWPILLLVLSILLGLEAMIAFPLMLILLVIKQRVNWLEIRKALKYGLDIKILFLLFAVMLYKATIENSDVAHAIFLNMESLGMPASIILISLPLMMGLAAGLSMAFAGIALPLLVPYIASDPGINGGALILAYTSGMVGLLLSPMHLCLILSAEYFKANLVKVYRYILPPAIILLTVAILAYYITT